MNWQPLFDYDLVMGSLMLIAVLLAIQIQISEKTIIKVLFAAVAITLLGSAFD